MLLRLGSVRGLDLDLFDFDYDLTWAALFLTADGRVLGRYGSRTAATGAKENNRAGLRHALDLAEEQFRNLPRAMPPRKIGPKTEDYPAARKLAPNACLHCHHVNEFRREADQAAEIWRKDQAWVYPEPENLGLTMRRERGDEISLVRPGSVAEGAGLRAGDRLLRVGKTPIASIADLRFALDQAPKIGTVEMVWSRDSGERKANLPLRSGWRETDLSWRWSLKSLMPEPPVDGDDLDLEERRRLGLSESTEHCLIIGRLRDQGA